MICDNVKGCVVSLDGQTKGRCLNKNGTPYSPTQRKKEKREIFEGADVAGKRKVANQDTRNKITDPEHTGKSNKGLQHDLLSFLLPNSYYLPYPCLQWPLVVRLTFETHSSKKPSRGHPSHEQLSPSPFLHPSSAGGVGPHPAAALRLPDSPAVLRSREHVRQVRRSSR